MWAWLSQHFDGMWCRRYRLERQRAERLDAEVTRLNAQIVVLQAMQDTSLGAAQASLKRIEHNTAALLAMHSPYATAVNGIMKREVQT